MNLPLTLKVEAAGATNDDLLIALDEVKRLISKGFHSGFDSNESGYFDFDMTISPSTSPDEP
jgi:hypothetical protein